MISAFAPNLMQSVSFLNILILSVNWFSSSSLKAKISKLSLLDSESLKLNMLNSTLCLTLHLLFDKKQLHSSVDASRISLPCVLPIHFPSKSTPFHCGGSTKGFTYSDSTQFQKTRVKKQPQSSIPFSFFWQMIHVHLINLLHRVYPYLLVIDGDPFILRHESWKPLLFSKCIKLLIKHSSVSLSPHLYLIFLHENFDWIY